MAQHHAAVTVNAPVHQVYTLFTHFNDFPKFMTFVKEVTYYDNQTSHWVTDVVGRHEWDAVNENWVEDQQVGWHSTRGMENVGKVTFESVSPTQTRVDTFIAYDPPGGFLGDIGEGLGAGKRFEDALQRDMDNFAHMVEQAPPGSLDPNASNYLFHSESAAATGTTTDRQDQTMGGPAKPLETPQGKEERPILDRDIIAEEGNTTGTPQSPTPPTYPSER